jgi:hypothetical protein
LEGQALLVLLVLRVRGERQAQQVQVLQQVQQVWRERVLLMAQRVQQVQAQRQVQQVLVDITPPKIPITITRIDMLVINFILILLVKAMDQAHTMQVIHTQFMHMGITLTTFIMVIIILPHPTCRTLPTQTGIVMLLLMF